MVGKKHHDSIAKTVTGVEVDAKISRSEFALLRGPAPWKVRAIFFSLREPCVISGETACEIGAKMGSIKAPAVNTVPNLRNVRRFTLMELMLLASVLLLRGLGEP